MRLITNRFLPVAFPGMLACISLALNAQTVSPPIPVLGDPLFAPIATGPITGEQKLMDYVVVTVGPQALLIPAVWAALRMANPPDRFPRAWKDGAGAFGRNYGETLATHTALETGRYITAALIREDFRYRPSTSKNAAARFLHAVAFTVVDRSDSGGNRLAIANFAGAGAAGFAGELYLPRGFNNLSHAETRVAIEFGGMVGQNVLREFSPDLARFLRKLKLPVPRDPIPDWWVPLDPH